MLKTTVAKRQGLCPYCRDPLIQDQDIVFCSACRTLHHGRCWHINKQCSVFGCSGMSVKTALNVHDISTSQLILAAVCGIGLAVLVILAAIMGAGWLPWVILGGFALFLDLIITRGISLFFKGSRCPACGYRHHEEGIDGYQSCPKCGARVMREYEVPSVLSTSPQEISASHDERKSEKT